MYSKLGRHNVYFGGRVLPLCREYSERILSSADIMSILGLGSYHSAGDTVSVF